MIAIDPGIGGAPYELAPVTWTDGGVNIIDDARLEVTRRMPAAGYSLAVAVLPGDERELYVGNGDGRLLRLAYSSGLQL